MFNIYLSDLFAGHLSDIPRSYHSLPKVLLGGWSIRVGKPNQTKRRQNQCLIILCCPATATLYCMEVDRYREFYLKTTEWRFGLYVRILKSICPINDARWFDRCLKGCACFTFPVKQVSRSSNRSSSRMFANGMDRSAGTQQGPARDSFQINLTRRTFISFDKVASLVSRSGEGQRCNIPWLSARSWNSPL